MASKNIIADLNKGEKLNGDNYNIWHLKIQYVLEEQEVLETINAEMEERQAVESNNNNAQFRRDLTAYNAWKRKDSTARGILISLMNDDLVYEYLQYQTAHAMWVALRENFGGTTVSKLRQLTIKFDSYKKVPNKSMKQHLRDMSNMILELKSTGHALTDEQQVQDMIRSLPHSWEHMKVNMTHNENIKTFANIVRHLEHEDEHLEAAKPDAQAYVAASSSKNVPGFKRKGNFQKFKGKGKRKFHETGKGPVKGRNFHKHYRGKRGGKKDKTKMT